MKSAERDQKLLLAMLELHADGSIACLTLPEQRAALVRCAYRIDGVDELADAAEDMHLGYDNEDEYFKKSKRLMAAITNVRNAMGGSK